MATTTANRKGATMMMTATQQQLMARFVADYNGGEPEDYLDEIETTYDAFAHYDGVAWVEAEGLVNDFDYGVPARHYGSVRAAKGQQTYSLWVMDFGDFRAICQL